MAKRVNQEDKKKPGLNFKLNFSISLEKDHKDSFEFACKNNDSDSSKEVRKMINRRMGIKPGEFSKVLRSDILKYIEKEKKKNA